MSNERATRPVVGLSIRASTSSRVATMMAKSGFFKDASDAAQAGVKINGRAGVGNRPVQRHERHSRHSGQGTVGAH